MILQGSHILGANFQCGEYRSQLSDVECSESHGDKGHCMQDGSQWHPRFNSSGLGRHRWHREAILEGGSKYCSTGSGFKAKIDT